MISIKETTSQAITISSVKSMENHASSPVLFKNISVVLKTKYV
jgi:hypothetical protein